MDARKVKGDDLLDPTIAKALPISIENPAIAYDPINDEFFVSSRSLARPVFSHITNFPSDYPDADVLALLTARLPEALDSGALKTKEQSPITGYATQTTLALIAGYVDGIELLLAGGLPAALDTGALKIREQSPITGYATQTTLALIAGYVDGLEALLAGGLPSVLDTDALKIREQNPLSLTALLKSGTTPGNAKVTLTSADTEYSYELPSGCRKFTAMLRDRTAWRGAWSSGKVATSTDPYFDVAAGEIYYEDGINATGAILYFASAGAGKIMTIITWT
jgi:hypothetical protein